MSGKTLIRFSKHILMELPSIASDSVSAFYGDTRAWIHTSERVLEAAGSTVSMCIQLHSIRKLTKEAKIEAEQMQEQYAEAEAAQMEQNRRKLSEIQSELRKEREKLEQRIDEEKKRTEIIKGQQVETKDIDREIQQDTDEIIGMMREKAAAQEKIEAAKGKLKQKKTALFLAQQQYHAEIVKNVRIGLKTAIDLFDEKIKTNPMLKELPQEEHLRLDEQYRLLVWQYQKNIEI